MKVKVKVYGCCVCFFSFCDGNIWLCCKISNRVFGLKELFNPVYDVMYFLNIELTAIQYINQISSIMSKYVNYF